MSEVSSECNSQREHFMINKNLLVGILFVSTRDTLSLPHGCVGSRLELCSSYIALFQDIWEVVLFK